MFWIKRYGSTRSASIWWLLWKNQKGFLTNFRGCTSSFRFDLFTQQLCQTEWGLSENLRKELVPPLKFVKNPFWFHATAKYLQSGFSHFFLSKTCFFKHPRIQKLSDNCKIFQPAWKRYHTGCTSDCYCSLAGTPASVSSSYRSTKRPHCICHCWGIFEQHGSLGRLTDAPNWN